MGFKALTWVFIHLLYIKVCVHLKKEIQIHLGWQEGEHVPCDERIYIFGWRIHLGHDGFRAVKLYYWILAGFLPKSD